MLLFSTLRMSITDVLPEIKSKASVTELARQSLSAESVQELMRLLSHPKLAAKAAWVLSHILDKKPALGQKHELWLLQCLETTTHSAVARFALRYLQSARISPQNRQYALEIALAYLEDPAQPVAPKAFAMRVAWRFAPTAQKNHIVKLIQAQLPHASPGFKSSARKILYDYQIVKEK